LAGAFVATIVAVSIIAPQLHRASPAPVARFSAELGVPDVTLTTRPVVDAIGLTRDGSMLVFVGLKGPDAVPLLYVRRLSEALATPLTGTDGADCPFFSPDGQWIGFFADGKLKKIGVRGGAAITLASAPLGRGGDWTDDGSIYFVPNRTGGVMRVLSSGGAAPERVTTLMQGEITQRWPQLLPDGKALLFTSNTAAATQTDASIVVQQLGASERKVIQKGYHGRYLPSGHLVYLHEGTLFAVAFDPARLQVTGPSVPLLEGVASNAGTGAAWFAASHAGLFAYVEGPNVTGEGIPMVWMDRQGKSLSLRDTRVPWLNLAISPVGDRVAFERLDDIWIYDWARDSAERVTSDPAADSNPTWTPDGSRIAFASTRGNAPASNIYWQRVHEAGGAQRLTTSPNEQHPGSWDPTGKFLAFEELNAGSNADIMILPMAGSEETGWHAGTPTVLVNGPSDERQPQFSPDGRWIAYVSNESGQYEVYVRSVRGTDRWPVSVSGGQSPIWSRTRPELYYEAGAIGSGGRIMVVGYTTEGGGFHPRKAELLMDERHETRGPNRMFDVHPDGNRFALAPFEQNNTRRTHVTFLLNYFDELRRLAPAGSP
jgi:serine/threonine-protein kinase